MVHPIGIRTGPGGPTAFGTSLLIALLAVSAVGCGQAPSVSPFPGPPAVYLLGIDQLGDPGFSVIESPASITAASLVGDAARGARLAGYGLQSAARVRFFRTVSNIATSNGPVDITASAARFRESAGAVRAMDQTVQAVEAARGERPVSTGPLGDDAHADQVSVTDPEGNHLIQFTVTWRLGNLLNIIAIRGREGGARITDALALAGRQINNELGLITFASTPRPGASPAK